MSTETKQKQPSIFCANAGGVMMAGMIKNFLDQQCQVYAWNRTYNRPNYQQVLEKGAIHVPSLDKAPYNDLKAVLLCASDVKDVEEIIDELSKFAPPETLIIDLTTIGPEASQRFADKLRRQGLRYLEAPVSGGDKGAREGTLTIMAGGDRADYDEAFPLLEIIGKNIVYCGEQGAGQSVKVINQLLCAAYQVGISEAFLLAEQQGIDPNLVIEICGSGAAGSWALTNLGPRVVNDDLNSGFAIKHMIKDLRLVREMIGQNKEEHYPGVQLASTLFKKAGALENAQNQGTHALIRAYRSD